MKSYKTFSFPCEEKEGEFKVTALRVDWGIVNSIELIRLISTMTKKGFEIKTIVPCGFFSLTAEIKGDKKDTQAIREELEKEGFTEQEFPQ